MNSNQVLQFAMQIQIAIDEAINSDESMAHIAPEAVHEYTTEFITALACVAPAMIYTKLTGDEDNDYLSFNHIANRLCMQLSRSTEAKEGGSDEKVDTGTEC